MGPRPGQGRPRAGSGPAAGQVGSGGRPVGTGRDESPRLSLLRRNNLRLPLPTGS